MVHHIRAHLFADVPFTGDPRDALRPFPAPIPAMWER